MLTVELRSDDATMPLLRLDGDPQTVAEVVAGFADDGPTIFAAAAGRVFFAGQPGFGSAGRSLDDPEEPAALRDLLAAALAGAEPFEPLVMFSKVDRPSTHFDRITVWDDDVAADFRLTDTLTAAGTSEGAIKAWITRQSAGPHHEGFLDLAHRGRRTAAQAKAERDRLAKLLADNPEKDRGRAAVLGSIDAAGDASTLARHDRIKGNQWSRERNALHNRIIDAEFAAAADVPHDRQAVLLGGLPGSGKSRLGEHPDLGLDPGRYLYIDPDHFKEVLLDAPGAVDRVAGMSAGEHAAIVHKESTYLVDLMIARALKQGKNVIIDRTMSLSPRPEMKLLARNGYRVRGVFADITVAEAVESADERWKHGSGRFVPEPFILDSKTPDARSKNLVKFQEAAKDMDDWAIVDQTGIAKRTPAGKVRRGSGTASFAAGVTVFRAIDYRQVTGVDHPGTAADQAAALDAGERVSIGGDCACALLNELANRVEPVDLTLLTIDGRRNVFADVKANQLRRVDMPQIPPDKLDDFAAHLRSVGVGVRHTSLDPLELRATQNELDGRKVGQMVQATQLGTMDAPPVWVSADGYVLDGTHRWAAEAVLASDLRRRMAVCQAACPMSTLIVMARAFADGAGIDSKAHGMRLRPIAFAGTSVGATKAWESRQRAKHPQPAAAAPSDDPDGIWASAIREDGDRIYAVNADGTPGGVYPSKPPPILLNIPDRAFRDEEDDPGTAHGQVNVAEDPKIQKMRDRYVVADTPTLEMNEAMRQGPPYSAGVKRRISEANKLTAGTAVKPMILHRGMVLDDGAADQLQPGATLVSKGFQSTGGTPGTGLAYAKSRFSDLGNTGTIVQMEVRVPPGSHVGPVGYSEYVLRPGSMRVVSRTETMDNAPTYGKDHPVRVVRLVVEHDEAR